MDKRNIVAFEAKNGSFSIKVDNTLLHSAYNPEEVCKKFIENNKELYMNKNIVVVYGIALGYHIQELLNVVSDVTNIYVFDVDEEIFSLGKNNNLYEKFINNDRIHIYIGLNDKFFYNLKLRLREVDDILLYNPSLMILPTKYSKIKNIFNNFKIAKTNIKEFKEIMEKNYKNNLKEKYLTMKDYYKTNIFKEESVIVASAGPSLDENIEEMKKLQKKMKIFCVGSALRTLIRNGIKPYMICIIDPSELVYNQIREFENLDVPLCFLNTASRWAVTKYNGPKYMFYNKKNIENDIVINTGKTVAISTIDIAAKGNPKRIILVGQDLAFIGNKSHTDYINESYKDANITNKVYGEISLFKTVKGVKGNILYTNSGYLNFKHFIELEIKKYPNIEFINCSSGAKIEGTKSKRISSL